MEANRKKPGFMEEKLVSCIIPVFNGGRYLAEAIDSILAQTYRPLEIIVVDDGSTDCTGQVATRYGRQLTYLRRSNQGSASARNAGLSAARGPLIAFLDADDLWHPQKLARQVARLQKPGRVDLCFTRFRNFWVPELAEEARRYRKHALSKPLSAYSISTLLTERTVFEKFGTFKDGLRGNENMLWFLYAAQMGATIEVLAETLMFRRFHPGNDTRKGLQHNLELFLPILKAWRDYRRQLPQ